jgi:uncharacterized protein (TIGR02246 family)
MSWVSIVAVVLAILAIPAAAAHAQVVAREVAIAAVADATEFVDLHDDYRAAASVGDAEALTRLFADDGVLVATDREVVRGRQQLSSYFSSAFGAASSAPAITFTRTSAENRNGFGSETGRFEERVTGPDGGVTRVSGVYVTIYRRDLSGRWRIAIEIRSRGDQQPLGSW